MVAKIETVAVIATEATVIAIVRMMVSGGIIVIVDSIGTGTAIAMSGAGKNSSGAGTDIGRGRMRIPTTATINTARTHMTTATTMVCTPALTMRSADNRTTLSARIFTSARAAAFYRSSDIGIPIARLIAMVFCAATKRAIKTGSDISSAEVFGGSANSRDALLDRSCVTILSEAKSDGREFRSNN